MSEAGVRRSEDGQWQVDLSLQAQAQSAMNRLASETGKLNMEIAQKDALVETLLDKIKSLESLLAESKQSGANMAEVEHHPSVPKSLRTVVDNPQA
jgi:hypothetical protein